MVKSKKDKDISEYKKVQVVSINQELLLDITSEITPKILENLKQSHLEKIDISDMIYLVDKICKKC